MRTLALTAFALASAMVIADAPTSTTQLNFKLDPRVAAVQNQPAAPIAYGKTIWGPTGLIFVPTAFTINAGELNWGAAFSRDYSAISLSYGVIRDVEIGATYLDRDGADNKIIANAKVHIVPANFDQFSLAVGVMDAADAVNQSFYIVGSTALAVPNYADDEGAIGFHLHAGVGTGYFDEKLFAGGELLFPRGFSVMGEWDTKNFNLGARYQFRNEFFASAGVYGTSLFFKMNYAMRF